MMSFGIGSIAISKEMLIIHIINMCLKITYTEFQLKLPVVNELTMEWIPQCSPVVESVAHSH